MVTGRPKITFDDSDWKKVENLCAIHCTAKEICGVMGISEETLNRLVFEKYNERFAEYFEKHSANGKASLRRTQFKLAEHNAAMAIFLGKQYLGQRDLVETYNDKQEEQFEKLLYALKNDS